MSPDLNSKRARKARVSVAIGKTGFEFLSLGAAIFAIVAATCLFLESLPRAGYASLSLALALAMLALWWKLDLAHIPPNQPAKNLDDSIAPELLAHLRANVTPAEAWTIALHSGPAAFTINHLLVPAQMAGAQLSTNPADMSQVWQQSAQLATQYGNGEIHAGTLTTALILTSPPLGEFLSHQKLSNEDVVKVYQWLERQLYYIERQQHKNVFGGIGRDWASGFTPMLDRFSQNISRGIEAAGGYGRYFAHEDSLDSVVNSLSQGSGVAIVGSSGTGKSTVVDGLADRLLRGRDKSLQYYQVVSLNASAIISAGGNRLEDLLLTLLGEAVHAGNIVLCIDEASLFFGSGVGAFDISQILLPVLKNRNVRIVAAFTPEEWQQLRLRNESLATGFSAVTIQEATLDETMHVLEDYVPYLEQRHNLLITYDAMRETVRLSGQYMQEQSYPGKAISLLEQAIPYASDKLVSAQTIQASLEKTRGLRVSAAQAPEAEALLHLEDHIHERMINQVRAVNVVASALRRGRAGVADPKRPVGSFLFLGPTGVGKTELARSLAATYFGDERRMIRLDMSEYQQAQDVSRLLSAGTQGEHSLLLAVREQPFSVVLLDEIEKAHPNILNLMLQMLDEGQLSDSQGKPASFRSCIIIATSNAGAQDIIERVRAKQSLDDFERPLINQLISSGQFKPELINRFDEVVLFRPLNQAELAQVASLMVGEVNKTLSAQNIRVELSADALQILAREGYDPEFGARPMRRLIQKTVQNAVAVKILQGEASAGSTITLDASDLTPKNLQANPDATETPQQTPQQ